jgi:hypothetical protein
MTNSESILATVRAHPGLTDTELRQRTGIDPHQQVNQICRRLATQGLLRRVNGPAGKIVNVRVWRGESNRPDMSVARPIRKQPPRAQPVRTRPQPAYQSGSDEPFPIPQLRGSLLIGPCSASKRLGGSTRTEGTSTFEVLPSDLASALRTARKALAPSAKVDESLLLPAWRRYTGNFYQASAASLADAVAGRVPIGRIQGITATAW